MRFANPLLLLPVLLALLASVAAARAQPLTERFDDPLDLDRSWLSEVSDIANYYGSPSERGNNPTGLWVTIDSPNPRDLAVTFEASFADSLATLSLDAACWSGEQTVFYAEDMEGVVVFEAPCDKNIDLPVLGYPHHYEVRSSNGIRRFGFRGHYRPGNTAIDNVTVTLREQEGQ
jgi:hypothetical protein